MVATPRIELGTQGFSIAHFYEIRIKTSFDIPC